MCRQITMLPWLLLCTLCIEIYAADILDLALTTGQHHVDVRCSFKTISYSNISHVTNLVLSRENGGTEEVLAVASCSTKDINKLQGATITSKLALNSSDESFIKIHWYNPETDVDGVYVCELHGFDEYYNHISMKEIKKLKLHKNPSLSVQPEAVQEGVTKSMTLNCSVRELSSIGIKQVMSIDIKAIGDVVGTVLASVDMYHETKATYGCNECANEGHVDSDLGVDRNYLAVTWMWPSSSLSGRYVCEISAMDNATMAVNFVKYMNIKIKSSSAEELKANIWTLEERIDVLRAKNDLLLSENIEKSARIVQLQHRDCSDFNFTTGRHRVTVMVGNSEVDVICEVDSAGKVWTIFHRRFNGSVDFYRNFSQFENGFGSTKGEFWLGLKNIKALLGCRKHRLRLTLEDVDGRHEINYSYFSLSESPKYTLTVDGNSDSKGLKYNNGTDFSTFDYGPARNCADASDRSSGWWFDSCSYSNLNGIYGKTGDKGMVWYSLKGTKNHLLSAAEMKFSPVQ